MSDRAGPSSLRRQTGHDNSRVAGTPIPIQSFHASYHNETVVLKDGTVREISVLHDEDDDEPLSNISDPCLRPSSDEARQRTAYRPRTRAWMDNDGQREAYVDQVMVATNANKAPPDPWRGPVVLGWNPGDPCPEDKKGKGKGRERDLGVSRWAGALLVPDIAVYSPNGHLARTIQPTMDTVAWVPTSRSLTPASHTTNAQPAPNTLLPLPNPVKPPRRLSSSEKCFSPNKVANFIQQMRTSGEDLNVTRRTFHCLERRLSKMAKEAESAADGLSRAGSSVPVVTRKNIQVAPVQVDPPRITPPVVQMTQSTSQADQAGVPMPSVTSVPAPPSSSNLIHGADNHNDDNDDFMQHLRDGVFAFKSGFDGNGSSTIPPLESNPAPTISRSGANMVSPTPSSAPPTSTTFQSLHLTTTHHRNSFSLDSPLNTHNSQQGSDFDLAGPCIPKRTCTERRQDSLEDAGLPADTREEGLDRPLDKRTRICTVDDGGNALTEAQPQSASSSSSQGRLQVSISLPPPDIVPNWTELSPISDPNFAQANNALNNSFEGQPLASSLNEYGLSSAYNGDPALNHPQAAQYASSSAATGLPVAADDSDAFPYSRDVGAYSTSQHAFGAASDLGPLPQQEFYNAQAFQPYYVQQDVHYSTVPLVPPSQANSTYPPSGLTPQITLPQCNWTESGVEFHQDTNPQTVMNASQTDSGAVPNPFTFFNPVKRSPGIVDQCLDPSGFSIAAGSSAQWYSSWQTVEQQPTAVTGPGGNAQAPNAFMPEMDAYSYSTSIPPSLTPHTAVPTAPLPPDDFNISAFYPDDSTQQIQMPYFQHDGQAVHANGQFIAPGLESQWQEDTAASTSSGYPQPGPSDGAAMNQWDSNMYYSQLPWDPNSNTMNADGSSVLFQ